MYSKKSFLPKILELEKIIDAIEDAPMSRNEIEALIYESIIAGFPLFEEKITNAQLLTQHANDMRIKADEIVNDYKTLNNEIILNADSTDVDNAANSILPEDEATQLALLLSGLNTFITAAP